jgi:hypothetical protein
MIYFHGPVIVAFIFFPLRKSACAVGAHPYMFSSDVMEWTRGWLLCDRDALWLNTSVTFITWFSGRSPAIVETRLSVFISSPPLSSSLDFPLPSRYAYSLLNTVSCVLGVSNRVPTNLGYCEHVSPLSPIVIFTRCSGKQLGTGRSSSRR